MRSQLNSPKPRKFRRKARVWRDPEAGCWRWECTLCHPPAYGCRTTDDAWYRIITTSLPHHFRVRVYHHRWVVSRYGRTVG
jgi:hypothetical protein